MICSAIITAGGTGKRFGTATPKQFSDLKGIPVIIRSLRIFENVDEIDNIIITSPPDWLSLTEELISEYSVKKVTDIIAGGETRRDSVWNALQLKSITDSDIILVHDAVRPSVSAKLVSDIISNVLTHGAVIPVCKPKETIKETDSEGFVRTTPDRTKLCQVQTPQGFRKDIILPAYENALAKDINATDDSSLVEVLGYKVKVIEGEETNIKITTQNDLRIAEYLIQ